MRFNNDDYLRAFPREEKSLNIQQPKQIVKDEPGDVLDTSGDYDTKIYPDPEPDDQGMEVNDDGAE